MKHTKGKLELKYVSGVCIGIGTVGKYSQITANSILPDTDEEYEQEKEEIEANMKLYASAPDLLEACEMAIGAITILAMGSPPENNGMVKRLKAVVKKATE